MDDPSEFAYPPTQRVADKKRVVKKSLRRGDDELMKKLAPPPPKRTSNRDEINLVSDDADGVVFYAEGEYTGLYLWGPSTGYAPKPFATLESTGLFALSAHSKGFAGGCVVYSGAAAGGEHYLLLGVRVGASRAQPWK